MKRKSIIDSISAYCESASPDAIALLQQIVNGYAKKSPVQNGTKAAAKPRNKKAEKPEVVEASNVT